MSNYLTMSSKEILDKNNLLSEHRSKNNTYLLDSGQIDLYSEKAISKETLVFEQNCSKGLPDLNLKDKDKIKNHEMFIMFAKLDNIKMVDHNYICVVSNLDYLQNKRKFNKYLNKFLDRCQNYEIKLYDKIDNKFHILEKRHVIDQINNAKKHIIKNHIASLENMFDDVITGESYIRVNNKIISMTHKMLLDLDKLIRITDDIYLYNLLCVKDSFKYSSGDSYVDFSEINDDINKASQFGYIDEYK